MLFTVVIWYTPEKLTAGTWKFQEQQQQQQQQQQRQREKHLNQTSIFSGSPAVSFTAYDTMVGFLCQADRLPAFHTVNLRPNRREESAQVGVM